MMGLPMPGTLAPERLEAEEATRATAATGELGPVNIAELGKRRARAGTATPRRRARAAIKSDIDFLASHRNQRQRTLADQDRDFQRKRREFQEDLNARKNEELQQVLERANRVVRQIAETEKYDLILQEAVYVNPKHDITEKVIRAINNAK